MADPSVTPRWRGVLGVEMLPGSLRFDAGDVVLTNPVSSGYGALAAGGPEYLQNLRRREFVGVNFFAAPRRDPAHSALPGGVLHVFGVGAQEEVIRVHARSIVAAVADIKPGRNGASMYLPRDAIGAPAFPPIRDHRVSPQGGAPADVAARERFRDGVVIETFSQGPGLFPGAENQIGHSRDYIAEACAPRGTPDRGSP